MLEVTYEIDGGISQIIGINDQWAEIIIKKNGKRIGFLGLTITDQIYVDNLRIPNKANRIKGYGTQAIEYVKGLSRIMNKPIFTDFETSGSMQFYLTNGFIRANNHSSSMYWIPEKMRTKNAYIVTDN